MDLDVVFLGTGGSVPSARRNTAAVLVRRGGDRFLFDWDGTQRQMQRSVGLIPVDDIFITHLHADHYLGLPGLIKSYEMQDRVEPLAIYGPPGLVALFDSLSRIVGRPRYAIELVELNRGETVEARRLRDRALRRRAPDRGQRLRALRASPPRTVRPERARALGVEPGPAFGALQRGEDVAGADGPVAPGQVMGEDRPGRKIVITGDTAPCEATKIAAHRAELLIHDASFAAAESDRAAETGHSTALQAAELAAEAEVGMLALVHISSRHFVPDILEEARAACPEPSRPRDFDVVEIPLPERGDPVLVEGGARDRARGEGAAGQSRTGSGFGARCYNDRHAPGSDRTCCRVCGVGVAGGARAGEAGPLPGQDQPGQEGAPDNRSQGRREVLRHSLHGRLQLRHIPGWAGLRPAVPEAESQRLQGSLQLPGQVRRRREGQAPGAPRGRSRLSRSVQGEVQLQGQVLRERQEVRHLSRTGNTVDGGTKR